MKFAIVLGRGVEGCGVTRCAIEAAKALNAKIFASIDKKWARRDLVEYDQFDEWKFSNADDTEKRINEINNNFDVVLFFSVPSKTHSIECQLNFQMFIDQINKPKILLQFDHRMASIRRNADMVKTCNKMDLLMMHSLTNDFSRFIDEEGIEVPKRKMTLGFDFDAHRRKWWKPISKQKKKTARWIGRLAGWKNPVLMMNFHNKFLKNLGFITILEGLEASIGYEGVLKQKIDGVEVPIDVVNKFRPRKELGETKEFVHGEELTNMPPYLYPPYDHDECMERLSLSTFGSDLYQLPERFYGNNIENCHAEVVACGAIPIFHKHFGMNVFDSNGLSAAEATGHGTIFLDESNMSKCAMLMNQIAHDLEARDVWRENAFEFWKKRADISIFYKEITDAALELIQEGKYE